MGLEWGVTRANGAVLALRLIFFAFIVETFLKIFASRSLAPTQTERLFAIVRGIALAGFAVLRVLVLRRIRPEANRTEATMRFGGRSRR